jgi:hypothetical protein
MRYMEACIFFDSDKRREEEVKALFYVKKRR